METFLSTKITHGDIASFAETVVNLSGECATEYRDQVNSLRERLEKYISENEGYALVKMLHAGSVAKGTALSTINDLDVAVYVKKEKAPQKDADLVSWIAERLREAYPNLNADQFDTNQPHCVTISFKGSGLDVDVVPVLYEGAANDFGYLINKRTGDRTLTSIPLHLEFIRTRKKKYPTHYSQVVRLVKWWARQRKISDSEFKCKSFFVELLVACLADKGLVDLADYPTALEKIFSYIVRTNLEERISFSDYYKADKLPSEKTGVIEIFDPVNPANNITNKYTRQDRDKLVTAAEEAGDSISEALTATTKSRAVDCWQRVFGASFRS